MHEPEVPERPPRWRVEQVIALAPRPTSVSAAQPLAVTSRWSGLGSDARAVWGRCSGSSAEPYDTVVDHVTVAFRCTCPSRMHPCKHALALLLLWVRGDVPSATAPSGVASWIARHRVGQGTETAAAAADNVTAGDQAIDAASPGDAAGAGGEVAADLEAGADVLPPQPPVDPTRGRDDRIARMSAGLVELDRWIDDRVRTGLADPTLARYSTWDGLAARLVDAQVGGLANRVRRLGGMVGSRPEWHQHVLAELAVLHLLARAGGRLRDLPPPLADSVAVALGWQVRQADVLAGVPVTDRWAVMGRSDTREDRIEVRRTWLRGRATGEWAMVLSFAAYRQSLDASLRVGSEVHVDLFRYPGAGLRALVGPQHSAPTPHVAEITETVADACHAIGSSFVDEPWLQRCPVVLRAAPARAGGRWVLGDATGSLPIAGDVPGWATVLACSGGGSVALTCEWTSDGLVPLTVHLADRVVDVGPVADTGFVDAGSLHPSLAIDASERLVPAS